jgi:hypothetical protein
MVYMPKFLLFTSVLSLMEFCNFLAKDRSVASESYQRWKVACSALCVHLSIGQVYAFSVFNKPLTKLLNTDQD